MFLFFRWELVGDNKDDFLRRIFRSISKGQADISGNSFQSLEKMNEKVLCIDKF